MLKGLGTVLRWIFTPVLALILLFEEWGWVPLSALLKRLALLPVWAACERRIAQLPPWAALLVLCVPAVALFPIKLAALYLLGHGQVVLGVCVLALAKIIGTALVARLFQITQPTLMQWAWFARWYPRWKAWKDALLEHIRASGVWQMGRRVKQQVLHTMQSIRRFWQK